MRPREQSVIFQSFVLFAGLNERWTFVVSLTADVCVAKQTDFVFGACLIAATTPQCARIDSLYFVFEQIGDAVNRRSGRRSQFFRFCRDANATAMESGQFV